MEEGDDRISSSFWKGNFGDGVEEDGLEKGPYRQEGSGPQTSVSILEIQILRHLPGPTESETRGVGCSNLCFDCVACHGLKLGLSRTMRLHYSLQMLFTFSH